MMSLFDVTNTPLPGIIKQVTESELQRSSPCC